MTYSHDIEVEVTFLVETQWGKASPKRTGYRSQFAYDGRDWDGIYTFSGTGEAVPGQPARAFISFLSPAEHLGKIEPGMPFLVRVGSVTVGQGKVLRIMDLEVSARRVGTVPATSHVLRKIED